MFRVQDRCMWLGERKGQVPDRVFWKARGTGSRTPALGLCFVGRRKTEVRSELGLKGEC